jgi:hypothetical protein
MAFDIGSEVEEPETGERDFGVVVHDLRFIAHIAEAFAGLQGRDSVVLCVSCDACGEEKGGNGDRGSGGRDTF